MNLAWLKKVAAMERSELIEAYEAEGKLRHKLALQVPKLEQEIRGLKTEVGRLKDQREGKKTIVARNFAGADYACRRLGLNPNRTTYLITDGVDTQYIVRGHSLDPEHVYFVRGWKGGKHANGLIQTLGPALRRADGTPVGLDCIAYAPDAHFDMHEDDDWEGATLALQAKRGIKP
jgi:hypothetical protein